MTISAGQIKAARAILGWSQDETAGKAGVSTTTIYNLEKSRNLERCQVTLRSVIDVRKTFERHGLEFLDGDGVRRRFEDVVIYRGPTSCERFFDDMLAAAETHDEEIIAVVQSQDILCRALGTEGVDEPERLLQLAELTNIKCILSDRTPLAFVTPSCEFRFLPRYVFGHPLFVCGDKYALVISEGCGLFNFVVFKSLLRAQTERHSFAPLWNEALPMVMQNPVQECGRPS